MKARQQASEQRGKIRVKILITLLTLGTLLCNSSEMFCSKRLVDRRVT